MNTRQGGQILVVCALGGSGHTAHEGDEEVYKEEYEWPVYINGQRLIASFSTL